MVYRKPLSIRRRITVTRLCARLLGFASALWVSEVVKHKEAGHRLCECMEDGGTKWGREVVISKDCVPYMHVKLGTG